MFDIVLPPEFEQVIIAGQGKDIHIEYEQNNNDDDDDEDGDAKESSDNQNNTLATASFVGQGVMAKC